MIWLRQVILQCINHYDELVDKIDWIHFLFASLFFRRRLHLISLFFVRYVVVQHRYFWWNYFLNNLSLLDGLLRLVIFLMVHRYFIMIMD